MRQRLISTDAWSDVAHNFRGDLQMLYKEIAIGLLISGFVAQLDHSFFHTLFLNSSSGLVQAVWGAVIGPVIAMLTFVCSVGNIPLAAVLWGGGISFAGVVAFIFADLVIVPIVLIYRKYYGTGYALRITALMLTTMVIAALIIEGLFHLLGWVPTGVRPDNAQIFTGIHFSYKLVLNVIAAVVFVALIALTKRRGVTDPVCGMKVDRRKAVKLSHGGHTHYFCCEECRAMFQREPEKYSGHAGHDHHDHKHHAPPPNPANGFEIKL